MTLSAEGLNAKPLPPAPHTSPHPQGCSSPSAPGEGAVGGRGGPPAREAQPLGGGGPTPLRAVLGRAGAASPPRPPRRGGVGRGGAAPRVSPARRAGGAGSLGAAAAGEALAGSAAAPRGNKAGPATHGERPEGRRRGAALRYVFPPRLRRRDGSCPGGRPRSGPAEAEVGNGQGGAPNRVEGKKRRANMEVRPAAGRCGDGAELGGPAAREGSQVRSAGGRPGRRASLPLGSARPLPAGGSGCRGFCPPLSLFPAAYVLWLRGRCPLRVAWRSGEPSVRSGPGCAGRCRRSAGKGCGGPWGSAPRAAAPRCAQQRDDSLSSSGKREWHVNVRRSGRFPRVRIQTPGCYCLL